MPRRDRSITAKRWYQNTVRPTRNILFFTLELATVLYVTVIRLKDIRTYVQCNLSRCPNSKIDFYAALCGWDRKLQKCMYSTHIRMYNTLPCSHPVS